MNCKPNQLARIIETEETRAFKIHGTIILTVKQVTSESGLPAWTYDGDPIIVKCPCGCGTRAQLTVIADEILRPIPGLNDDIKTLTVEVQPGAPIKILEPV